MYMYFIYWMKQLVQVGMKVYKQDKLKSFLFKAFKLPLKISKF